MFLQNSCNTVDKFSNRTNTSNYRKKYQPDEFYNFLFSFFENTYNEHIIENFEVNNPTEQNLEKKSIANLTPQKIEKLTLFSQTPNFTHTWTISNFTNLANETNPTVLLSDLFPSQKNVLSFFLRMLVNYDTDYVALFLIINDLQFCNLPDDKINVEFSYKIKINDKLICESELEKKEFTKNKNSQNFKTFLKKKYWNK